MGIGSGTAALIGGLASAGGSVASGILGSNAASNAASEQSQAAEQAAQLQYQASQNSLGFQEGEYNNSQQELAPWLQSGAGALSNLDYLTGVNQPSSLSGQPNGTASPAGNAIPGNGPTSTAIPANGGQAGMTPISTTGVPPGTGVPGSGQTQLPTANAPAPINTSASPNTSLGAAGSLLTPYSGTFTAPTAAEANASPAEQAQLAIGNQQLQQSAAARGNLLTGGTAEALQGYGENVAAENYQNVYNNAYNTYASGYNQYQNQQANTFNRLSALSGGGQTTAATLGTLGQSAANSVTSNELGTASQIGQDTQNAGAANASGIVGSTNAITGAIGGATSNLSQMALLQNLLGGSSSGGGSGISSSDWGNSGSEYF